MGRKWFRDKNSLKIDALLFDMMVLNYFLKQSFTKEILEHVHRLIPI